MKTAVLILLSLSCLAAQTRAVRGKRVIDDGLAALGGNHYLAMQDRIERGRAYSFYREQLSGLTQAAIYTRYLTRPEPPTLKFFGLREREAFGKNEDAGSVLLTETGGYDITFRGARPLPKEQWGRFIDSTRRNIFYILRQRLGEPGLIFDSRGSDVWENQPVEIVQIIDANNESVTVYFSQSTKLPLYQSFYRRDPTTKERIQEATVFSKFRDVGNGVQWPYTTHRERNGEKIYEMFSETVEINKDLNDSLFTLPANMKILERK
jgi:hypothetical protein